MSEERIFTRHEAPTAGPVGQGGRVREVSKAELAATFPGRLRPNDADFEAMIAWVLTTPRFVAGAPAKYAVRLGLSPGLAKRLEADMLRALAVRRVIERQGDFWVVRSPPAGAAAGLRG